MTITAIIFDLDETLIEDGDATARALVKVSKYAQEQWGVDAKKLQSAAYQHAKRLWRAAPTFPYCDFIGISASEGMWGRFAGNDPNLQALYQWVPIYQRELWLQALAEQGVENKGAAEELASLFNRERRSYTTFSEVETVLQELRPHYKLAMLTNGAPDLQREKVEQVKLAPYFDTIVVSGEAGVGKPDREVFQVVLNALAIAPEQAVMVGDSLPRDMVGARRSGIGSIWINRCAINCAEEYIQAVDTEIACLDKLAVLL